LQAGRSVAAGHRFSQKMYSLVLSIVSLSRKCSP